MRVQCNEKASDEAFFATIENSSAPAAAESTLGGT